MGKTAFVGMTTLDRLVRRRDQRLFRVVQRLSGCGGLVQQKIAATNGRTVCVNGRSLLNFASTNYLGLQTHPLVIKAICRSAEEYGSELGMPRLLATTALTLRLEKAIAKFVAQDAALVFPSTQHIAVDLLPMLAGPNGVLLVDERAYPISLIGVNLAAGMGSRIIRFAHNHVGAVADALAKYAHCREKVIVCDGVYSGEGSVAPLRHFAALARQYDAVVYVDDAHGFGVLGERASWKRPFGQSGSGTPAFLGIRDGNLVHVGTFSKAFGVPLAFVAGPGYFINHVRATANSFVHSSSPAMPVIGGALGVLEVNLRHGEARRRQLVHHIKQFRRNLIGINNRLGSSLFPIQSLYFSSQQQAADAGRKLKQCGIWPVIQFQPFEQPRGSVLRFAITAAHRSSDIDFLTQKIQSIGL